ncbi:VanZ family protein [Henriciella marina]|uniref:VanZ family protein n=1 Tax=Henriciella marina TaxID=453851 RepID=UPI0003620114
MVRAILWFARTGFLALYAAIIFLSLASVESDVNVVHLIPSDKAGHFLGYFALTSIAILAFPRIPIAVLAVIIITQSAAVEVAQPFFGRTADIYDLLANLVGVAGAVAPVISKNLRERMRA